MPCFLMALDGMHVHEYYDTLSLILFYAEDPDCNYDWGSHLV